MNIQIKKKKKEHLSPVLLERHGADPNNSTTPAANPELDNSVTCISGASCETFQLSGQTVEAARSFLSPVLNIDPNAMVLINGIESTDSHVLETGDQLEFVKKAGEKGATGNV